MEGLPPDLFSSFITPVYSSTARLAGRRFPPATHDKAPSYRLNQTRPTNWYRVATYGRCTLKVRHVTSEQAYDSNAWAGRMTKEEIRLGECQRREKHWKRWGPYLSERAWGTVREDYSPYGTAWEYLPHDHARSRAYRWNEDGLAGICDRHQLICFALSLWNERDPILKERLFGLTGNEGNHGEDVKEYYFYLDSTPTHSYMKYLYKYPHAPFPYSQLVDENRNRGKDEPEFELLDTGVFEQGRYFDVFVEYAKSATTWIRSGSRLR
jgi:hypothetical protein